MPVHVKDSDTAVAIAFGAFIAAWSAAVASSGWPRTASPSVEFVGGVLAAIAVGLLLGVQSYYVNRWLRKRGYGIGGDDE